MAGTTSGIFGIVLLTVTFIVVAGLAALYMRHKRSTSHEFLDGFGRVTMIDIGDELEVSMSSGSGVGKPFLQQRTIAKEVSVRDVTELIPKSSICRSNVSHTPSHSGIFK